MNYTENYHLPQWEETDRIMRVDFNQMCADVEAGIMDARGRAEEGDAVVKAAADAAMTKAREAYSPKNMPYVIDSYVGTGHQFLDLTLGFRPKFILITGQPSHDKPGGEEAFVLAGPGTCSGLVSFRETGVRIYTYDTSYPKLSVAGRTYYYVAFR